MRGWLCILVAPIAIELALARPAHGDAPPHTSSLASDVAAPLPSKDMRWYATAAYALDLGSLPSASPGLALGGGVRRGGLGASLVASGFLPQVDRTSASGPSVALYDALAMVCALAPFGWTLAAGACGGGGVGLLHATSRASAVDASAVALRPEGVATARVDVALGRSLVLSAAAGATVDPLRTRLEPTGSGDAYRASWVGFRGSLGIHVRLW